jgi:hypothetical protein
VTESDLWRKMVAGTKKMPWLTMDRIENSVGAGFPDVDGFSNAAPWMNGIEPRHSGSLWHRVACPGKFHFKIELKIMRGKQIKRVKFRNSQHIWFSRRVLVGDLAHFVLAEDEDTGVIYLWKGSDHKSIEAFGPDASGVRAYPKDKDRWKEIFLDISDYDWRETDRQTRMGVKRHALAMTLAASYPDDD